MINLLKNIHDKTEKLAGRRILTFFLVIFILFAGLGIYIGYLNSLRLKQNEIELLRTQESNNQTAKQQLAYYEGKIEYFNPSFYPKDKISYVLVDGSGKEIILLKSRDQKLSVAEGLNVKVGGVLSKTLDGSKSVLNVSEVVIKSKNVTN